MNVLGVCWNWPVCPSIHVYVYLCVYKNTCFCQSAGGCIKSHLVTVLVTPLKIKDAQNLHCDLACALFLVIFFAGNLFEKI